MSISFESSGYTQKDAYENFVKIFPTDELAVVKGTKEESKRHVLKFKETEVQARYATFNTPKGGNAINIMFITDLHLNRISEADLKENNPAVMDSMVKRVWCRDEESLPALKNAMLYADKFDALVLGGDSIDYLTMGSIDCLKENVFDISKKPVIAVVGGHDMTRAMESNVADPNIANVKETLQSRWIHDIDYYSMVLDDRVMLIGINNGAGYFLSGQKEKLAADIEKARKENMMILIFEHEPIATKDEENKEVNFFSTTENHPIGYLDGIGGEQDNGNEESRAVYDLITHNADVIKGLFCGHMHYNYYLEVKASYNVDGKTVKTVIPQYVQRCNAYGAGNIFAITVK